jgi:hypothetical protein
LITGAWLIALLLNGEPQRTLERREFAVEGGDRQHGLATGLGGEPVRLVLLDPRARYVYRPAGTQGGPQGFKAALQGIRGTSTVLLIVQDQRVEQVVHQHLLLFGADELGSANLLPARL